jgi:cathepsin A (carboxypeptidase C)
VPSNTSSGESYGGHYAPSVASRIFNGNLKKEGLFINLAGVGVGNGLTDPVIQYQYYPEMAMNNSYGIKTVSDATYKSMVDHLPKCLKLAEACQLNNDACVAADDYCNAVETSPYYSTGLNPYDIRKPCGDSDLCYDFTNIETFLNLNSTRAALHVSDKVQKWESCNNGVNAMFAGDWMRSYQQVTSASIHDISLLSFDRSYCPQLYVQWSNITIRSWTFIPRSSDISPIWMMI